MTKCITFSVLLSLFWALLLTLGSCSPAGKEVRGNLSKLRRVEHQLVSAVTMTSEEEAQFLDSLEQKRKETRTLYPDEPKILLPKNFGKAESEKVPVVPYRFATELTAWGNKLFAEVPSQSPVPTEMSKEELMFAWGWIHRNAEKYKDIIGTRAMIDVTTAKGSISKLGFSLPEVKPIQEVVRLWYSYYLATGEKARSLAKLVKAVPPWEYYIFNGDEITSADFLDRITSPITGKIIEFNHPTFSPGNMWIDAFTLPELRAKYPSELDKWLNSFYPSNPLIQHGVSERDAALVVYRAYGSTGVIRTGYVLVDNKNKMALTRTW